jgi:hypothetical protein
MPGKRKKSSVKVACKVLQKAQGRAEEKLQLEQQRRGGAAPTAASSLPSPRVLPQPPRLCSNCGVFFARPRCSSPAGTSSLSVLFGSSNPASSSAPAAPNGPYPRCGSQSRRQRERSHPHNFQDGKLRVIGRQTSCRATLRMFAAVVSAPVSSRAGVAPGPGLCG